MTSEGKRTEIMFDDTMNPQAPMTDGDNEGSTEAETPAEETESTDDAA